MTSKQVLIALLGAILAASDKRTRLIPRCFLDLEPQAVRYPLPSQEPQAVRHPFPVVGPALDLQKGFRLLLPL